MILETGFVSLHTSTQFLLSIPASPINTYKSHTQGRVYPRGGGKFKIPPDYIMV